MIGLDTNILIRYFAQDDPLQSRQATHIIETQLSSETPGFISSIVLVEMIWTLIRLYNVSTEDMLSIVNEIIHADDLKLEHKEETWKAYQAVRAKHLDFADALLGAINHKQGCQYTLTFDRKAATHPLFKAA